MCMHHAYIMNFSPFLCYVEVTCVACHSSYQENFKLPSKIRSTRLDSDVEISQIQMLFFPLHVAHTILRTQQKSINFVINFNPKGERKNAGGKNESETRKLAMKERK